MNGLISMTHYQTLKHRIIHTGVIVFKFVSFFCKKSAKNAFLDQKMDFNHFFFHFIRKIIIEYI